MTVTTREQARKKQFSLFLESMKVYEEVYGDDVPSGTRVMSGRWVETMKPPTVWKVKWTVRGYGEPHSDEDCFAATATIQGVVKVCRHERQKVAKRSWETTHRLLPTLKCETASNSSHSHLNGGRPNIFWTGGGLCGRCGNVRPADIAATLARAHHEKS